MAAAFSRTIVSVIWPERKTTNSSPPRRPTMSLARNSRDRIWAALWMAWSPAKWPRVSLTCLKLSRSTINSAQFSPGAMSRRRSLMYCSAAGRFNRPDMASMLTRSRSSSTWCCSLCTAGSPCLDSSMPYPLSFPDGGQLGQCAASPIPQVQTGSRPASSAGLSHSKFRQNIFYVSIDKLRHKNIISQSSGMKRAILPFRKIFHPPPTEICNKLPISGCHSG